MIEVKSTLEGTTQEINPEFGYVVDFSKLTSVNDLILIMSAMGISFPGNHPFINEVKPFLNMDKPFPLPKQQRQEFIPLKKD